MHDYKLYKAHINTLEKTLVGAHHRQLVLITGSTVWCYELLGELLQTENTLVVSKNTRLNNAQWPNRTHQILGQEYSHAVYDGFSGLHPDKLAAIAGTVKAGGILYLLLPELSELSTWPDPALSTVQSHGHKVSYSFFNERIARVVQSLPAYHFSELHGCTGNISRESSANKIDFEPQQHCVENIIKVAHGRANRPLLINADRGRGKSAALGLAAAKLIDKKILLCSTQFKATHSSFKHLSNELNIPFDGKSKQLANLQYIAPDSLLDSLPECDLLLVDEAAAIPVPLLLKMLKQYPRIVFASTLVGYEGNGRGYTIRFSQYIKAKYKAANIITLDEPLRFTKADPLERHIRTLLALEAQYEEIQSNGLNNLVHSEITQQQLTNDELLLEQVIALLALAHYQSSVNDLRQLLDAPSQRLFITQTHNHLVGVCLVTIEGGLPLELTEQVLKGERRPQGHLMAQTLSQLSSDPQCLTQLSARVVRIAVAPNLHSQGVGKALLSFCESRVSNECYWFGASFGATAELLKFWQSQGFSTIKLGYQKDKSTGEHSALVVKCLNNNTGTLKRLKAEFQTDIFYALLTHFKHLDWQLVNVLISSFTDRPISSDIKKRLIRQLNNHFSRFSITATIWQVVTLAPSVVNCLTQSDKQLLISLILQNESDTNVIEQLNIQGKKELETCFKQAVLKLAKAIK